MLRRTLVLCAVALIAATQGGDAWARGGHGSGHSGHSGHVGHSGKGRSSTSGASTAAMSSTTRISSGASSLGGGGFSRRLGGSGRYVRYYGPAPELDPSRKINEQDCTRPIELDGGNLRCK